MSRDKEEVIRKSCENFAKFSLEIDGELSGSMSGRVPYDKDKKGRM